MPPPNPAPGLLKNGWLVPKAGLARARMQLPLGGFGEDHCFDVQQAAELAIKAVYQQQGWLFAYVHDLGQLLSGLKTNGLSVSPEIEQAARLSIYAAQTRYPGLTARVTQPEFEEALKIGETVVAWAKTFVPVTS